MLAVENLEVVYEDVILVLRGVSLTVPDGGVVALLGANGAGKTTLLRAIAGLLDVHRGEITGGSITFDTRPLHTLDAPAVVAAGITATLEGRRVLRPLTVDENLRVGGHTLARGELADTLERVYTLFGALASRRDQPAGTLSGGEQQMLAIGRALMSRPRCLLLDEPSLGLAPRIVEQLGRLIADINAQGTAVLLVEQNARMALSVASHGYVLETGRVVMDASAERLAADDDVRTFYLGVEGSQRVSFRDVKHYRRRRRWLS